MTISGHHHQFYRHTNYHTTLIQVKSTVHTFYISVMQEFKMFISSIYKKTDISTNEKWLFLPVWRHSQRRPRLVDEVWAKCRRSPGHSNPFRTRAGSDLWARPSCSQNWQGKRWSGLRQRWSRSVSRPGAFWSGASPTVPGWYIMIINSNTHTTTSWLSIQMQFM